jgi:hypothetical protein
MLKISSAMDIGWPLPLGSDVDQIHAPPSSLHVPTEIGACAFAAGEEVFRRRRDKYV